MRHEYQKVLLIEDDDVDILTMERAFRDLNIKNPLEIATNGKLGLEALLKENQRPSLIILDINMPQMNGIEFLKELRNIEHLKDTPVIVLTTSKEEADKKAVYSYNVAGYMIKPPEYDDFLDLMKTIELYWSRSVQPTE